MSRFSSSSSGQRPKLKLAPLSPEKQALADAGKAAMDKLKEVQQARSNLIHERTTSFRNAGITQVVWADSASKHMLDEGGEDNTAGLTKTNVINLVKNSRNHFTAQPSSDRYAYVYDVDGKKSIIVAWTGSASAKVFHVGPSMAGTQ